MIRTQTTSNIVTQPAEMLYLANRTTTTSYGTLNMTTVTPTSNTSRHVFTPPSGNVLKILPSCAEATGFSMRVVGWNLADTVWVPTVVYQGTATLGGPSWEGFFTPSVWATQYGTAQEYSGTTTHPGFIVVDTLGAKLVQISTLSTTSDIDYRVLVGAF